MNLVFNYYYYNMFALLIHIACIVVVLLILCFMVEEWCNLIIWNKMYYGYFWIEFYDVFEDIICWVNDSIINSWLMSVVKFHMYVIINILLLQIVVGFVLYLSCWVCLGWVNKYSKLYERREILVIYIYGVLLLR